MCPIDVINSRLHRCSQTDPATVALLIRSYVAQAGGVYVWRSRLLRQVHASTHYVTKYPFLELSLAAAQRN